MIRSADRSSSSAATGNVTSPAGLHQHAGLHSSGVVPAATAARRARLGC